MPVKRCKKIPILKGKKSDRRVSKLHKEGYNIKKVTMLNGDIVIMKKKKEKKKNNKVNK